MKKKSDSNENDQVTTRNYVHDNIAVSDRREFLSVTTKSALFSALTMTSYSTAILAKDTQAALSQNIVTPPPSEIMYFETGMTQWLFIKGSFTWSQAMRMSTSVAITDGYGTGWLLAPMWKPQDFVDAATVTKAAMGDRRNVTGPFIGVFQIPGSEEPKDGFVNLDGSVPFMTWGDRDPNDGAPRHSSGFFKDLLSSLKTAAPLVISWFTGEMITADKINPVIDLAVNGVSTPPLNKGSREDVVALWHAKNGTITANDTNLQLQNSVLLSRRKPVRQPITGPLPSWPKVNNTTDLFDGMKVPRRSTLYWAWTGGAKLGQVQIVNIKTGITVSNRSEASTPRADLSSFLPGAYMLRVRNISKYSDPWLEIGFVIV